MNAQRRELMAEVDKIIVIAKKHIEEHKATCLDPNCKSVQIMESIELARMAIEIMVDNNVPGLFQLFVAAISRQTMSIIEDKSVLAPIRRAMQMLMID